MVVLDEPSNYLDRESLGALSTALSEFGGGVVVISHSKGARLMLGLLWAVEAVEVMHRLFLLTPCAIARGCAARCATSVC